ncbi:hypothetical protein YC2023_072021 [Brassica napus]
MPTRDQRMLLLGLRWHLMRNQSFWVLGGVWSQGCNLKELTEGHHQEWSLRLNLTQHGETYQEFLVSASHQLALTTSLPFVHTAHRSYRLNDPVKCSDRGDVGGSPSATSREVNLRKDHCRTLETERPENDETSLSVGRFLTVPADSVFWLDRTHSFRISPNPGTKSVKENATKQPAFANPETVFVRKQCCNVKSKTTLCNGYLGSRIDEERSEMRYMNPVNNRVFERKLRPNLLSEGTSAWVSQIVVPHPLEDMGRKLISRVLPHADIRSVLTCGGEFNSRHIVRRSGPKALDDPKSSTRPQVRRDHPLSLSISISGGKETNKDSLSNGERTGKSPA